MAGAAALVLVADGDRHVRTAFGRALAAAGYRIATAESLQEARAACERERPGLAIVGFDLSELPHVESSWLKEISFICLSAHVQPKWVEHAAEAGALACLVKPIDPVDVVPTVEAALACGRGLARLRASERRLAGILERSRETHLAVGILMQRYGTSRQDVYAALRRYARRHGRRVAQVASDFIRACELEQELADAIRRNL